jgi:hypothetical protein
MISGARPIASASDPNVLTCPADCRLLVFPSLSSSHHFWLKVSSLLTFTSLASHEAVYDAYDME